MAVAADSVESLLQLHRNRSPWLYWLILLGVFLALLSLPLIRVDVTISAPGMVRPIQEKVVLKSAVAGQITEVLVADNTVVRMGETLLRIDSKEIDERMDHLQVQIERHSILKDDLQNLLRELTEYTAEAKGSGNNNSGASFQSLEPLASRLGRTMATSYLKAEVERLKAQLSTNAVAMNKVSGQQARYDILALKGLVTNQEHDNARLETLRLSAERNLLLEQAVTNWQTRLREEEDALVNLRSEERRLVDELDGYAIKSPMDGVVIGFTGWSAGVFVQGGQTLGAVSPEAALVVESYVAPRDIGQIVIGQKVRLQVDSFPYTQWGMLEGIVSDVGADLSPDANDSALFYKVTIRPESNQLTLSNGLRGDLLRGMTLVARYRVSRRSLLQIIYEDTSAWLNPYRGVNTSESNPFPRQFRSGMKTKI